MAGFTLPVQVGDLLIADARFLSGNPWLGVSPLKIYVSRDAENHCLDHCQPVFHVFPTHRIHGAGIYANITGVYWWDPWHTIYSSTVRIRQGFGRSSVTTEMLRMLRCHAPHLWNWAKHSPTFAKIFMISPFRLLLPRWPRWLCRVWWVWGIRSGTPQKTCK